VAKHTISGSFVQNEPLYTFFQMTSGRYSNQPGEPDKLRVQYFRVW
jgi:hypothetical protein